MQEQLPISSEYPIKEIDMSTLKEVFDEQFDQVKFNRDLCKRIIRYSQSFMTRNEDHNAFFGGVLLGVNPIRFLESDREAWYEDVLDVDEELLRNRFKDVKAINHDFKVMSDVFNYTSIYIAHRLERETNIPQKLRKEAQTHAFMVLHYRFLTSLLVTRFRYPADPAVAQATYAALSGRYDIRRYGSWRALLEARSEDLVSPNSIYRRAIKEFKPDAQLIRVVTDTQGRIREVVKKIYAVYRETLRAGVRVTSTSDAMVTTDGEMVLKDRHNGYSVYIRYMNEVAQSESNLIKPELIDVISSAMPTMPPKLLTESLTYLSKNYNQRNQKYLEEIVNETLLYMFDYLQSNRSVLGRKNDLPGLLTKLRSLLMASRSSDATVLKLRQHTEKLVRQSVTTRNNAVIASVRTGVLLYITLRALTKDHYS
jgi:hypothetical protein